MKKPSHPASKIGLDIAKAKDITEAALKVLGVLEDLPCETVLSALGTAMTIVRSQQAGCRGSRPQTEVTS